MRWIYLFEPASGCEPSPQDMTHIDGFLDSLAAHPCDSGSPSHLGLHVTCTFMRPPAPPEDYSNRAPSTSQPSMRPFWLVKSSSSSSQCLVDRDKESVTQADGRINELIEKKLDYKEKNIVKIDGRSYELGNLLISPSAVTHVAAIGGQASFLGHIVEVGVKENAAIKMEGEWPRDSASRSIGDTLNEALSSISEMHGLTIEAKAGDWSLHIPRLCLIDSPCLENMAKRSPGGKFGSMLQAFYYCEVAALLLKRQQRGP